MKIKGIIFDFGFTLFSFNSPSVENYFNCFLQGLKQSASLLKELNIFKDDKIVDRFIKLFNKKRMSFFRQSIKTKIEIPTTEIFQNILEDMVKKEYIEDFGELSQENYLKLANLYHSFELDEWVPFEQTEKTLKKLSEIEDLKLAVLSNHPHHPTIKELLNKYELTEYFDTIVTSAKFGKRKPHPDIFHHTIEKMGLKHENRDSCLMCGDEYADIVGGNRVGMQTILCERTVKFPYEKEIPLSNIKKVANISEILEYVK